MRYVIAAAGLVVLMGTAAYAQTPDVCTKEATTKKLAGAAKTSYLTKCGNDAKTACEKSAAEKKLAGAAKTSHMKKCVTEFKPAT